MENIDLDGYQNDNVAHRRVTSKLVVSLAIGQP